MNLLIGSHVSFTKDSQLLGSVEEAVSYGDNTFMFYTGAPQNTNRIPISSEKTKEAYEVMKVNNINNENVLVHAPYIINLANPDSNIRSFAISFLKQEIERCKSLGVKKIILHPGSHVNNGEEVGISNIIDALNQILVSDSDIILCLETMAGKGSECGYNIEQLKIIIDGVKYNDKLMICLDTCHMNDAGYNLNDFDLLLDDIDRLIGINKIGCIHVNDSKNNRGDKKDRHANIGYGTIGFGILLNVIYNKRLEKVPKILETPYIVDDNTSYPPYKFEIDMIKNKKINEDLFNDIKEYYKNN